MSTAIVALPIGTSGKQSKWTLIHRQGDFVIHEKIDHELSAPTERELDRVLPEATRRLGKKKIAWKKTQSSAGRWIARAEVKA